MLAFGMLHYGLAFEWVDWVLLYRFAFELVAWVLPYGLAYCVVAPPDAVGAE